MEVAPNLYEIAYSPRHDTLYVASAGVWEADTPPSRIIRLDPRTLASRGEIVLERKGFGLLLDDANERLYVGHTTTGAVSIINTGENSIIGTVQLAEPTANAEGKPKFVHNFREIRIDHTHNRLFAPGLGAEDSALYVADLATMRVEKGIPGLGFVATGIAIDEEAGRVYVANLAGKLFVFDTGTLELLHTWTPGVDQMLNLALSPSRPLALSPSRPMADTSMPWMRDSPGSTRCAPRSSLTSSPPAPATGWR